MPEQWTRIETPDYVHYVDEPLFRAWLDEAARWSAPDHEARVDAVTPAQQREASLPAWRAIGNALRALDLRPPAVASYFGSLRGAYGAAFRLPAPDRPVSSRAGVGPDAGSIGQFAGQLYQRVRDGNVPWDAWQPVRIQLGSAGEVVTSCLDTAEGACERAFPDRYEADGRPCPYPRDWRCTGIEGNAVLAPLVLSLRLARAIVTSLQGQAPRAIVDSAVRFAGNAANVSGGASPPTHVVGDPPGWTRPVGTIFVPLGTGLTSTEPEPLPPPPPPEPEPEPESEPVTSPGINPDTPRVTPTRTTPTEPARREPTSTEPGTSRADGGTSRLTTQDGGASAAPWLIGAAVVGLILWSQRSTRRKR